jgi:DNA topoisomerase I
MNRTVGRAFNSVSPENERCPEPSAPTSSPEVLKAVAKAARLRYVSDRSRGIRRERTDDRFVYFNAWGEKIADEDELARIRKLTIPPAYRDVSICPYANGHIQACAAERNRKAA